MDKKKALLAGGAAAVSLIIALPVFAAEAVTNGTTPPAKAWQAFGGRLAGRGPGMGVAGTVTAVNGSTITLTSRDGGTYTIDASNASFTKDAGTAITLADIKVGDTLLVGGNVVTATLTASKIHDGALPVPSADRGMPFQKRATFGTVASVSGSSFTLTRRGPGGAATVTVTTDANTTYKKNGQADTFADVTLGARVVVMGTRDASGNVAATSVNIMVPHTTPQN
ncbi:MAG: hypothetical protein KGI41_03840 [Patescibacteria group bacterium]|nr:hypothetical protein [Patescibacteria group bacterium]MDE1966342.1 hypothetical protein [Patescibacteria group bacterium]